MSGGLVIATGPV